jgi:FecR protein
MTNRKSWLPVALVAVAVAIVAGVGVALWMRHEQNVSAAALPNAARIQQVEGQVALTNGLAYENQNAPTSAATDQWFVATANQPFSVGDRIYTRDNSRTSIAFTGRNFARLDPNTSLDLLAFDESRTQLALREGSAIFDVGYLAPGQLFEVATPYGAVDFNEPGLYNIGLQNDGSVLVSVLSGLAQVVGLGGNGQISKGEILTLVGQTAADVVLSRLDGRNAGYLVDDYYRYQYPQTYDGRYHDYNAYLSDPYYFDPYRRYASYRYVSGVIPGIYDLDYYGDWQNLNGYGYAWRPRVDTGWAPYQEGYWLADYPYGPTWVSSEPWGYAPYHYGRWAYVGNQWYWVPDGVNTLPAYSPALVAFVPFDGNQIGWVPLGPGDPYAPRYYDSNWQPYYLSRTDIVQPHLVNLGVPGAVAVLPVDQFGRIVEPRRIGRVDPQALANVRPVLDPLTLTPLRNAVVHSAWGRGKIDLPPGIAKKLDETRVVTSVVPPAPPFRKNLVRELRVERVPEKAKGEKLKIRDERGNQSVRAREDIQQPLSPGRDSEAVERETKQMEKQQKRAEGRVVQPTGSAEGARVANPVRRGVPKMERPTKPEGAKPAQNAPPQRVEQQRMKQEVKQTQRVQQQVEQQQVHPRGEPKAVESNPAPVKKQQQPGGKVEYKGPPASPQGDGKGKGRKP